MKGGSSGSALFSMECYYYRSSDFRTKMGWEWGRLAMRGTKLMTEWTNFVGALHGAAAAFLVDT